MLQANSYLTRGALTLQGDGLRRFQYNPRLEDIAETIPRGSIVDRNGIPLATSDPAELVKHREALLNDSVPRSIPASRVAAGEAPGRIYPFEGRTFHLLGDLRTRSTGRRATPPTPSATRASASRATTTTPPWSRSRSRTGRSRSWSSSTTASSFPCSATATSRSTRM